MLALLADDEPILRPSPFPLCATSVFLHHVLHQGGQPVRVGSLA